MCIFVVGLTIPCHIHANMSAELFCERGWPTHIHHITSTATTCLMCLSVAGLILLIHGGVLCEAGGPFMSHDIHMLYVWQSQCVAGPAISSQS